MSSFVKLSFAAIPPLACLGAGAGVLLGWHRAAAGFPLLLVDTVRSTLAWTLLGTVVFLALFVAGRRLLASRLRTSLLVPVAAGLAALPFVALAGYSLNRARAVLPRDFLKPYALLPNLYLLGASFLAYVALCYVLRFWERRRRPAAWPTVGVAAVLLALYAGLALAFRDERKTEGPDVLVLLVDALRADHLSSYGYGRETTPAIDTLARDGVLFRQAISQSTFTKTSIASLFTGKNPYQHGLYEGQLKLPDGTYTADVLDAGETTLAEAFRAAGYLTGAWVQNSHLRAVMGFSQGFVEYHDQQGPIRRIHRRFFPWLERAGARYSFFAYLHYIDLHDPYRPPPPYDRLFGSYSDVYAGVDFREWGSFLQSVRSGEKTLSAADIEQLRAYYDGQLRAIDDEIGKLLDRLKESGLYERSTIVLTADHGDGFMEHGFISHSTTPYDELVRVPLIVKLPGNEHAGQVVKEQVRLIDVMPTLLELVGAEAPAGMAGCSLVPLIRSGAALDPDCRTAVSEVHREDGEPILALRTERYKFIYQADAPAELYDLALDPGETRNRAESSPDEAQPFSELALRLCKLRDRTDADQLQLDERTLRELKALGYVGDG